MAAGVTWPLADELTDGVLEERLFAASGSKPGTRRRAEPDWAALAREMKRPGVNLTVLWEEYGAAHPGGYGYSRFCQLYRDFEHRLSPTMRQHHVAGDKVFVDYSGKTVPIADRGTGEVRPAQLFVAVLGASNYTYAEVSWTQGLQDWIGAHVHMFAFFQGCPRLVVPDNLKSGIHKPSFYDPEINRTYARMAAHLPGWHLAGAAAQTGRQGQSRGGCPLCPVLHPRSAAPPHLLLAGRGPDCGPTSGDADERAPDAPPRHQPAPVVRGDRASSAPVAARH
jgi:transposase